jgi:multidrug efflux pump subunit AcrA (membrane-fusion protein)
MAALLDAEERQLPAAEADAAIDARLGQAKALATQLEQALDSQWQSMQLADETRERSRLAQSARGDAARARLEAELGELGALAMKAGWDPESSGRLVDWLAERLQVPR